jgi:HK97 family phage portal protein
VRFWPFKKSDPVSETKGELTDCDSPSWEALLAGSLPSATGVAVNAESAMACAPVNAAVTLITSSIGLLPCKLFKRAMDGKDVADDHAAATLVHKDANDWQSAGKVREAVTVDALLHGDGFGFVTKVAGRPVEILHLKRSAVTVEYLDSGEPRYKIGTRRYKPDTVIHLQAPSIDGKCGLGLLRAGRDSIGLAILLERTSARLFRNNSKPGGILSAKTSLRPDAAKRILEAWALTNGGDNVGGVAVLDNETKYTATAFTSVDSQHLEQRNFAIAEIARLTRVPVTMLQELSHGTFANTEQQALQFLQLCLLPWLKNWTDAYRRTLLTKSERDEYSFEFVVDDILRADTATRAEAYAKFRSMGAFTANDVRRLESMPALPGGDELSNPYTSTGKPANDNPEPKEENAAA